MAKARAKASVRDRAISAWIKHHEEIGYFQPKNLQVRKSRSKNTITVATKVFGYMSLTWSYKGGKLRRLTASEAAGVKGLSACISGEYA